MLILKFCFDSPTPESLLGFFYALPVLRSWRLILLNGGICTNFMLKLNHTFNFATFPTFDSTLYTNSNVIVVIHMSCLCFRKFRNGFREMTQAQSQKKQA